MSIRLLVGDCRDRLRDLPDRSINCVVTSPPYFGLRDYGTGQWEGGTADCVHEPSDEWIRNAVTANQGAIGNPTGMIAAAKLRWLNKDGSCPDCGATKTDNQIGLEPTPDEFAAALVEVFREIRRVLRDDGVAWLNLGDSYAGSGKGPTGNIGNRFFDSGAEYGVDYPTKTVPSGCKPKDLIGIPWLVAFALRADGWFLRQEIIWHKPNPMPESVVDRCTKAHEQIFLLAKSGSTKVWKHETGVWTSKRPDPDYIWRNGLSGDELPFETDPAPPHEKSDPWRRVNRWQARDYFYDADAIAEESSTGDDRRPYGSEGAWELDGRPAEQRHGGKPRLPGNKTHSGAELYEAGDQHHRKAGGLVQYAEKQRGKAKKWAERRAEGEADRHGLDGAAAAGAGDFYTGEKRNKRSVWSVTTKGFSEAHFATYPPDLIEPCILAGAPERRCVECGAPVPRIDGAWKRGCGHEGDIEPGLVLDPFGGAGTTALVADRLGRDSFLCELNPEYAALAQKRIEREAGMFSDFRIIEREA